jgi:hypothetical protein
VQPDATIHLPDPDEDVPNRFRLALSALSGLGLGLALVFALAPARPGGVENAAGVGGERVEGGEENSTDDRESGRAGNGERVAENLAEPDPASDRRSNDTAADIPETASVVPPEEGTAPGTEARKSEVVSIDKVGGERLRRVVPGRTAYLRCEGVPLVSGPFPCPRDREMEREVWRILRGLAQCTRDDCGYGRADVRLDYKRGEHTLVRVLRPSRFDSAVNEDAVYECVGEALTSVPTTLNPEYMVVSFRLELQVVP